MAYVRTYHPLTCEASTKFGYYTFIVLCALLIASFLCPSETIAGETKMWKDANGQTHFGDSPPPQAGSRTVAPSQMNDVSDYYNPQNQLQRMQQDRNARVQQWRDDFDDGGSRHDIDSFAEERRMRELEMEKRKIRKQSDRRYRDAASKGRYYYYDSQGAEDMRGINREMEIIRKRQYD